MENIYKKMGQRAFGTCSKTTGNKRPPSPDAETTAAPSKKPAVADPQNGLFQGQPDPTLTEVVQPASKPAKEPKIPAIFLDAVADWETHAAKLVELTEGELNCTARGEGYRVQVSSVADFRQVQRYFCDAKVPFHTFSLGRGQGLKVVISGLPADMTKDRLLEHLEERRFDVEDAVRLHTARGPTKSWMVTMVPDHEREAQSKKAALVYKISRAFFVTVQVTHYRRPAGPAQCHRCQGFGHGSSNCYRPPRCVRCAGAHLTPACKRAPGERGICCNCGGEHNANYRGCPSYKAAKAKLQRRVDLARTSNAKPPEKRRKLETTADPSSDEEPPVDEEEMEDPRPRRKRKRPPRNPANRKAKQGKAATSEAKRSSRKPRPPKPPPDPPQPPSPVARPERDHGPEPGSSTLLASLIQQLTSALGQRDVAATLVEILRQLTTLVGLLRDLFPGASSPVEQ